MSINTPTTTLTCSFAITANSAANAQFFATIVDDLRKTGVTDYQLTSNIAAQIVDATTIGAPTTDGQIVVVRNGGQEQRNLGLLSNLRNDITNNRVPVFSRQPMNLRPMDKVSVFIVLLVASPTGATATDTLYLTIQTVAIKPIGVSAAKSTTSGKGFASIFGRTS
jgi:hypothetical protein